MRHLCNTAALQGTKVAKAGELAKLWKYRAKQKKKELKEKDPELGWSAPTGNAAHAVRDVDDRMRLI